MAQWTLQVSVDDLNEVFTNVFPTGGRARGGAPIAWRPRRLRHPHPNGKARSTRTIVTYAQVRDAA